MAVDAVMVVPCRRDPGSWDLPTTGGAARAQVAAAAVTACLVGCPLRRCDSCLVGARKQPPGHDCVQAGLVWHGGVSYTLDEFLAHDPILGKTVPVPVPPCGTRRKYAWHLRHREPPCPLCTAANTAGSAASNRRQRERRAERRRAEEVAA